MANYRRGRINEEMAKEMAAILRDIKDPRVSNAFVSITSVDVAPDLKTAKVYYSAMSGDKKELKKGLYSASGYFRKRIAEALNLRMTPEFTFVPDDSISYGAHINELLRSIETKNGEEGGENE